MSDRELDNEDKQKVFIAVESSKVKPQESQIEESTAILNLLKFKTQHKHFYCVSRPGKIVHKRSKPLGCA